MLDKLSRYYFNEGLKKAKDGMISSALCDLKKSIDYCPNNMEAWKLAGLCFYRLGRLAAAERCWAVCLQSGGTDADAEGYIKDVRVLEEKVEPLMAEVYMCSSKKKYGKAASVFSKKVLPVLNSQADAFSFLGILRMLSGCKRKASREWRNALLLDASSVPAVRYLASLEHDGRNGVRKRVLNWIAPDKKS